MIPQQIGFVGAGQMAQALARGFCRAGLVPARQIVAADPHAAALEQLRGGLPEVRVAADNPAVVCAADVIVLAVKPQQMDSVLRQLAATSKDGKLFISIAAGVTLARLTRGLKTDRVIRVMPNAPCLVGAGAAAYCLGDGATADDERLAAQLLGAVGTTRRLPEPLMDAVTGLSGSGPAFIYQVIEALSDGGVRMGLSREDALHLAAQTVLGAAQMVLTTGEHPAVLKDRVASPAGTTIAGLQALERGRLRGTLMAAVEAATRRSAELGSLPPNN
jgi:pyrroline-5-carboxylate reductase